MQIAVLGSAAGGGFPQWNCNCRNCAGLRSGTLRARARTQSSICVRGTGADWALINASPDVLAQIRAYAPLQPARTQRDTGIAAVVLMDAQIDHVTGLFMLRERGSPLPLWCTELVREDLTLSNPVLRVLGHYCGVDHHAIALDGSEFEVAGVPGVRFSALTLASEAPPYSPRRGRPEPGDNVGLMMRDAASSRRLFYAPGLGAISPMVRDAMMAADCVLVDGTFWTDDEMQRQGFSKKRARDMGHLPQSGEGGMLEVLGTLPAATRKVLIHINNTNPILDEDSPERAACDEAGVEIAWDGMEIEL